MPSSYELFHKLGRNSEHSISWKCQQGRITFHFFAEYSDMNAALGTELPVKELYKELLQRSSQILRQVTTEVQVVVKWVEGTECQLSVRFSAAEFVEILKGEWPSSENFNHIARAVRGEKSYPTPESEVPGGGGKSMTAQGQTKKPDAHSHDRHR